jgi:hypothetical protein
MRASFAALNTNVMGPEAGTRAFAARVWRRYGEE